MCLFAAYADFFFTKSMIRSIVTRICFIFYIAVENVQATKQEICVTLQGFMSVQLIVFCGVVQTVVTPVVRAELPLSSLFFPSNSFILYQTQKPALISWWSFLFCSQILKLGIAIDCTLWSVVIWPTDPNISAALNVIDEDWFDGVASTFTELIVTLM
jgi:hypothetical protein